jgi:DNA repair protein RadD
MIQFRDYQDECHAALWSWFERGAGSPLVVLPTGSGKSFVGARWMMDAYKKFPRTRILMATHQRELIEQDYRALMTLWPEAPAGIYSAGLNRKQTHQPIIFAGVQSIYRVIEKFDAFDMLIVDEAHLISKNASTMYGKLISVLREKNPSLKIIGLTATPYRLDSGSLLDGDMFDGIAFNLPVTRLIEQGHLSPLISKSPGAQIDMTGAKIRMGDYVKDEMQSRAGAVTQEAVREIVDKGIDRKSWLAFCVSVEHATDVCDEIRSHGVSAAVVTGDTPKDVRDRLLCEYKAGHIRALCNVNVLTTGFDAPQTDLLAFLRPTKSTGLYVQMAGRGMRIAPGKENCLVLDFAGVVDEHGPIDLIPLIPEKKKKGDPPMSKTCPECGEIVGPRAKECGECGYEFGEADGFERGDPDDKISASSGTSAILAMYEDDAWEDVRDVCYVRHQKDGSPDSMRVGYLVGTKEVSEWVCFEHSGQARYSAERWWARNAVGAPPSTVTEALERREDIHHPEQVILARDGKYKRIANVKLAPAQLKLEIPAAN